MSNTIQFQWTGAQLKTLFANGTTNTEESIVLQNSLLNQNGPVIWLGGSVRAINMGIYNVNFWFPPQTSLGSSVWGQDDSLQPVNVPDGMLLSDGKLRIYIKIYDAGKHLSDIPDTAILSIVGQFTIPTTAPGSDTAADLSAFISATQKVNSTVTRSLNTWFQPSSTRDVFANYSVDIAAAISLTTGQQGTVFLEYADTNTGTNTVEVCRRTNGNSGTLTVGLSLTQTVTGALSGMIPAGKWARLRTNNDTGTPVFTYRSGQEVKM